MPGEAATNFFQTLFATVAVIAIAIFAGAKLWEIIAPRLRKPRHIPELCIVAGLGGALLDWRVIPHFEMEIWEAAEWAWTLHEGGWLFFGSGAVALLGLYWKMRGDRNPK